MSQLLRVAAVDLGATSGRVMVAEVGDGHLELSEVHRFPNGAVRVGDSLHWDVLGIHREVLAGLRMVALDGRLDGIGVDSWAVDHGLLDRTGALLGNPFSHRDARTDGVAATVLDRVGADELYGVTGLQQLPFNTIYQLVAAAGTPQLEVAATLLLIPDLLCHWLTGGIGAEHTNASTTGLYDVRARAWATALAEQVGVPASVLPALREPGEVLGALLPHVAEDVGADTSVPVIAVGSHDTASAVVAVPAEGENFAYISSGTWSLVGLELDAPVLSEAARLADFTNEGGVDGTIRFLKNVTGLWVLSESVRVWNADLSSLLAAAARATPLRSVVDINDARLIPPGDMPARLVALAHDADEPVPPTPVEVTRC
ncbi:MAG: rhamnulokinase, partial [Nocardioides sp.]|nr:rhamnulokinase [Nocardioides sp.]